MIEKNKMISYSWDEIVSMYKELEYMVVLIRTPKNGH